MLRGRRAERREDRHGGDSVYHQMRQRLMSMGDDYWIETDRGQRAYKVDGKALRLRKTLIFEDPDGRELAQPVAVVTGRGPSEEPVGMTVSSLTSASLVPPLLLFCPAVTSRAWAAARERGSFAVNILGHQHADLAVRFAGPGDRFAGVRTLPTDDGLPALADALTVLVCDVDAEYPAGDHAVVLGRVRAVHALRDGTGLDTVSLRGRSTPSRGHATRLAPCATTNPGRPARLIAHRSPRLAHAHRTGDPPVSPAGVDRFPDGHPSLRERPSAHAHRGGRLSCGRATSGFQGVAVPASTRSGRSSWFAEPEARAGGSHRAR